MRVWALTAGAALLVCGGALALGGAALATSPDQAATATADARGEPGERLGRLINERIRADGPFFTASERAVIEHACGYSAGSYDGFSANMSDGEFVCSNGRRVDSPEIRAVMAAAGPRIEARVDGIMDSAEIRDAIEEVTRTAQAAAMRGIDAARIGREASARAQVDVDRAMAEAQRAIAQARREQRSGKRR